MPNAPISGTGTDSAEVTAREASPSTVAAMGGTVLKRLRTRERRFALMTGLYAVSVVLLFSSAGRYWWTARVTLPVTGAGTVRPVVTGLSPTWLVHHGLLGQFAGIPTPIAYALLGCGLGAASVLLRSGVVGIPAIVCEVFAWHSISAATASLTAAGTSVTLVSGASLFTGALVVTTVLLVLTSAQLAWINHRIHVIEREEARKAGRPMQPTVLDMAHSFQLATLTRFTRGADVPEREARVARHEVPPR